ncbi:MAG: glycosyltransferase family 39 protein [Deltaproteobacteria bacterium]|nr:glycosyltransferase family 39 protein [Deltaproteobacteria bacterium]
MNKPFKKEILLVLLCLLMGFALRFYTYDQKSLWLDEIYTFNDSRYGIQEQLKYYEENPTFLHPPLFFILTHLFYPFTKPERDLRIIPLIFGTLSIPMFYFLARSFSPNIAISCTLSLSLMTYHIYLSQDGRSYSLLLFFGMAGLYFFLKHLETLKNRYLIPVALFFASSFYTSYSSIPFIALSQILWFYRANEENHKKLSSFLILNGLVFLLCLPWVLFAAVNYKGQPLMDPYQLRFPISLGDFLYGIFHDWVPHLPLIITSITLLILFPFFSKNKRNALILLAVFIFPIVALYLFCKLWNVNHFVTSRYFINFLPLFFIALYLSLSAIEDRFKRLKGVMRLRVLFVILFTASNLVILPFYYNAEKQDLRGLVNYLKGQLREGDKIFDFNMTYVPGILHYFRVYPEGRHYIIPFQKFSGKEIEFKKSFVYKNKNYTIYSSYTCCQEYVADGSRLWIVAGKNTAKTIKKTLPCVLKGYFDGSFLNFNRFPTDASIYLFLWDPKSPEEKGIDMPIE